MLLAMPVSAQDITKTYRVAINKTSYPYHFINKDNKPDGMMVELWQLWAEKQGAKVEFVALNWQETLEQVQDGRVDIHAGLSQNTYRAEMFDFSSAFFSSK